MTLSFRQRTIVLLPTNNKAIFAVIQHATHTFWDAHLKGDDAAKQLLKSGAIARDAGVNVEYETR